MSAELYFLCQVSTIKDLEDRKLFLDKYENGTNSGLDSFITTKTILHAPILQLVDNCTYGTIAFLYIKSSLTSGRTERHC